MKLIITKGLPASGKTTWSRSQNAKRVNKDDLRAMIDNGKWTSGNEKDILAVRDLIITHYIKHSDVIVDDTNLAQKHEASLRELAVKVGADFVIQDFTNVSVDECIERDSKRHNYVGEKVIRKMYNQYLRQIPTVITNNSLPKAIICDLDGTLCLFGNKNPYDRDFAEDSINPAVECILRGTSPDTTILFTSGRSDKYREVTQNWLDKHNLKGILLMRKEGDERKDYVVKNEIYDNYIKYNYNVVFILDDRDQVVRLWRSMGLPCLQVNDGNF